MRKRIHELIRHLLKEHNDPAKMGQAVALGLFVGVLPFYGLHLVICVALAWVFKLNKATVYLAANISNPLFAPVLVAVGIALGELVRFGRWQGVDLEGARGFLDTLKLLGGQVPDMFLSCLIGSAVLGAALAAVFGPVTYLWARRRKARRALSPDSTPAEGHEE
jgi:uncharacterized protein (DUF2062 family)